MDGKGDLSSLRPYEIRQQRVRTKLGPENIEKSGGFGCTLERKRKRQLNCI